MDRETLDRWARWGVTGALTALLVWAFLATGALRRPDFLVVQALAIFAGLCWCVRLWFGPEPRLLVSAMGWPVLAFAGYAVFRYWTADLEYVARWELIRILICVLVLFLAMNHLHRQRLSNALILTVVAVATLVAGYAFYQYIARYDRVWHFVRPGQYTGRGSGTFICPNHLAAFLEVLLPLALAGIFWGKHKVITKILLVYAALWLLVGIGVTLSRGAWIATGLGLILFALSLMWEHRYRLWAMGMVILLVIGGIVFETRTGTIHKRFKADNPDDFAQDVGIRRAVWYSAFKVWQAEPWLGAGPGHFDYRFRPYRLPRGQGRPERTHSDYLNVLADYGVVGAIPLALALFFFFRAPWKHWSKRFLRAGEGGEASTRSAVIVGGAVGVAMLLLHAVVDYPLHVPACVLLVAAVMGAVIAQSTGKQSDTRANLNLIGRLAATVIILPALGYLGWQLYAGFQEWRWLARGAAETRDANVQIAAYEKAFALEPGNFDTAFTLGEIHRRLSWQEPEDFKNWAEKALPWYEQASRINPADPYSPVRYAMCLDRLGRHEESEQYYQRAFNLDPNNADMHAYYGWHFVQLEDLATAKKHFLKAIHLKWGHAFALQYLRIVDERLMNAPKSPAR